MDGETTSARAFEFGGSWREFAPIAFTNLLLTLVTLGIYSFWAKARERRYLWSQTRFIDDRLEWTGTGMELFVGYLLAILLFAIPLAGLQFLVQALVIRGHGGAAALLVIGLYLLLLYLIGLAVFRALRYRLSRTYWHGIRGGSDDQGFGYALSYMWKTIVGGLAFGLLVPWAMVGLWIQRWNAMSFGPYSFRAGGRSGRLMGRYLLYYLLPIVAFIGFGVLFATMGPKLGESPQEVANSFFVGAFIGYVVFFLLLGLVSLVFYSAYFREVVSNLSLGDLDFGFTARTTDWIKLMLGNIALVVFTLGIGTIFLGYRNWSFFVRHMHAYGTLELDEFTQSTTRAPRQGEGLLDAFDVGAV